MISERMAFPMVVTMVLLAALVVAPAAARTITTNGAGIFIGEENLDFAGDFAGTTQLVHYTGIVGQSSIDKSLTLSSGILSELFKGIPTGNYYDPANTPHYINVQNPEATLDVMLNSSPRDSVNGKSINRGTSLDFKFYSNVNTGAMANVELTLPSGGVVTVYNNTALWFSANGQTQYIPGIIFGQDAEVGTYTAAAKWARS